MHVMYWPANVQCLQTGIHYEHVKSFFNLCTIIVNTRGIPSLLTWQTSEFTRATLYCAEVVGTQTGFRNGTVTEIRNFEFHSFSAKNEVPTNR